MQIHQQSQPYLKIEASITGIHNEITNLKEMVLELKAEAEKPRTSVVIPLSEYMRMSRDIKHARVV